MPTITEYRNELYCRGCNGDKALDLQVCWNCFKHCTDIEPLKYFDGDTHEWIEYARQERGLQ